MKKQHRVPSIALQRKPEPISERYTEEIERALRRAEKAWRQAARRAQKAEKRYRQAPTEPARREYELVLAEAERLRVEFEEWDRLMRQAPVSSSHRGAGQARHRTGNDDHLEQGIYKRPKRPKGRR